MDLPVNDTFCLPVNDTAGLSFNDTIDKGDVTPFNDTIG